jgi:pyruvate kinase
LIHFEEVLGDAKNLSFTPKGIAREFQIGDEIDIDSHSVSLQVMEVNRENCIAKVLESGKVGSCKVAEVGRKMQLPAITPKDEQAIEIGKEMGIRHFALSFANSQKDVDLFRSKVGKDSICYF